MCTKYTKTKSTPTKTPSMPTKTSSTSTKTPSTPNKTQNTPTNVNLYHNVKLHSKIQIYAVLL